MTILDEEKIENLSRLCRLRMSKEEIERFKQDISKIVSYVEQLAEVDLTNLPTHSHLEERGMESMREDEVKYTLSRTDFLANTSKHIAGMVAVPLVMKS
jgi:aspartyl/glutamyl-tRNA(Asn/Gln) amidotransferase C subunit